MTIRPLTIAELPLLEDGAKEFYASSSVLRKFDIGQFCGFWSKIMESGLGVIIGLYDGPLVCGAISGIMYPDPNSGELTMTECFWFVRPGMRGGGLGLLRFLERFSREHKCVQLRMVHLVDSMPERLTTLYRRLGYKPIETHYAKDIAA